eukprot:gene608-1270_t
MTTNPSATAVIQLQDDPLREQIELLEKQPTASNKEENDLESQDKTSKEEKHCTTQHNDEPIEGSNATSEERAAVIHPFKLYFILPFEIMAKSFGKHRKAYRRFFYSVVLLVYVAYFLAALILDFKRAENLLIVTVFAVVCLLLWLIKRYLGKFITRRIVTPVILKLKPYKKVIKWICIAAMILFVILWIALDTAKTPTRLVSLAGLAVYMILIFIASNNKRKIVWRPVLLGLFLQFLLGVLILRTRPGYLVFKWIGDRISIFVTMSDAGAKFLFGDPHYLSHFVAFKVLPSVVFFCSVIYSLYYLKVMPVVIKSVGWFLSLFLGTSAAESLSAAGNIFVGMLEAPLLVKPFLNNLTDSELFAVMTGGMATIAGSVFGAFISFGASPSHILTASVMSAPAALSISKLMFPETQTPKTMRVDEIEIEDSPEKSVLEALVNGATLSIALVANIGVSIIMILGVLTLLDTILTWLGMMVGLNNLNFKLIFSYVFMPCAYLMGVEWNDAFKVGELLGVKTFVNEFVAYQTLGTTYMNNRKNGLAGPKLSLRSEIIATYALCGFSNFQGLGIMIGGLSALIPNKRDIISRIALRSLFSGTVACFTTACIAGLLYKE